MQNRKTGMMGSDPHVRTPRNSVMGRDVFWRSYSSFTLEIGPLPSTFMKTLMKMVQWVPQDHTKSRQEALILLYCI